jgi:hypothetical protein
MGESYPLMGIYNKLLTVKSINAVIMALIILIIGIGHFYYGELILKGAGVGWDGKIYRDIAMDFHNMIVDREISIYRLQRVFPSALLHYLLKLLQVPLESNVIMLSFRIYNLILLVLAAYLWGLICIKLKLTPQVQWLAFIGLFVNFMAFKYFFIYPILTDQTALFLGVLLLYFYLHDHKLGMILTSIVGMFTWPLVAYYGLTLNAFPKSNILITETKSSENKQGKILFVLMTTVIVLLMLKSTTLVGEWMKAPSLLYLSIMIVVFYIAFGSWFLYYKEVIIDAYHVLRSHKWINILISVIIMILLNLLVNYWGKEGNNSNLWLTLPETINRGVGLPAIFLVAHAVFFGPIVLIMLFFWDKMTIFTTRFGFGFWLVIFANFILSLASESRVLIAAVPFFIILVSLALNEIHLKPSFMWFFLVISLVFSKIWYRMNLDWKNGFSQAFYMNFGFSMSWEMYALQGGIILWLAVILYIMVRSSKNREV